MGFKKNLFFAGAFAACAFAAPLPDCTEDVESGTGGLTAATLVTIAPKTKSCEGGSFPDECADATRAAAALNKAFETYKITSKGEQAAIVAYELFESGDFKFNKNHFPAPGRPGQGTRMMAMPPFIEKYATAVAGADAVQQAKAKGGDAGLAAVLDLVNSDDEKSFGSAAWFVTTQCTADVRAGLAAGTEDGWTKFLVDCVGTTADPARNPAWVAAIANIKS